eukprot:243737_1
MPRKAPRKHNAKWTEEDKKTLMTLHNNGKTFKQIGSILHRTKLSIKWQFGELTKNKPKKIKQIKQEYYVPYTKVPYPEQEHPPIPGIWWFCKCTDDIADIDDIILCAYCYDVLSHKCCFNITDEMVENPHFRFKCYPCQNINEDKTTQNEEYQELTTQQINRLKVADIITIVIDINEEQSEMDEDMQCREFKITKISGTKLTLRACTINGHRSSGRKEIDTDSYPIYRKTKT